MRDAVLQAPVVGDFYERFRGENLPDRQFLVNGAVESFEVPKERVEDFIEIFIQTLKDAELLEDVGSGKNGYRRHPSHRTRQRRWRAANKKLSKGLTVQATDTCFVMMLFAEPLGGYYASMYQPAMRKRNSKRLGLTLKFSGLEKLSTRFGQAFVARCFGSELTGRIQTCSTNLAWRMRSASLSF